MQQIYGRTGNPPSPPGKQEGDQARCGERSFSLPLLNLPASLLTIAFSDQRLLDAEFLARLQVKGVPLDFPDDVLLQNLPLEAVEGFLHRFAVLQRYLSQMAPPTLTTIPIHCSALTDRPDFSCGITWPLPASVPSRLEPAFPSVPCRACRSHLVLRRW